MLGYKSCRLQRPQFDLLKPKQIMMDRFIALLALFACMFVVGGRPTENSKQETGNNALPNTVAPPKMTEVLTTTREHPPTTSARAQRSTLLSRRSSTITSEIGLISILSTNDPIQTDPESTKDSPLFPFISDVRKLNILVVVLAAALMVLIAVILVLGILRRSMKRKIRRMKREKDETTTFDVAVTPPPTTSHFFNVETANQRVEYEVPYAHQQAMTEQIMALANQNPAHNNVTTQTAPNGLPVITTTMDDGEYVDPSVFKAIPEKNECAEQTVDSQEYKVPRNATKRAGLTASEEHLAINSGTLKDSRGYVVMMDYAGPAEDPAKSRDINAEPGHKQHVYDVPVKTGRSADTFSRKTIKTKIKLFQEKLKSDKSKHVAPEDGKGTQKDSVASESLANTTAYDTPRI